MSEPVRKIESRNSRDLKEREDDRRWLEEQEWKKDMKDLDLQVEIVENPNERKIHMDDH